MAPKVFIVGSGGREHALVDALQRSACSPEVIAAPGNAGIASKAQCHNLLLHDVDALVRLAQQEHVDLVIVGPELPLTLGLADRLREVGVAVFGPSARAARLEASKTYAKTLMTAAGVPTARWARFTDVDAACDFAQQLGGTAVVKADGLAAGKGVVVGVDAAQTATAIREILGGRFGESGRCVIVEEKLHGPEVSIMVIADGQTIVPLCPSQDHKRLLDGDLGDNTGGMGAVAPLPLGVYSLEDLVATCIQPIVRTLANQAEPYVGVLYAGIMLTPDGPRVLEYNVRFGDPECQVLLPLLKSDPFEMFYAAATQTLVADHVQFAHEKAVNVVLAAHGYPQHPRLGDVITGLEALEEGDNLRVYHAGTQRHGEHLITQGGRVLSLTGLGPRFDLAAQRVYQAIDKIHFLGMHYRRDIGSSVLKPSL